MILRCLRVMRRYASVYFMYSNRPFTHIWTGLHKPYLLKFTWNVHRINLHLRYNWDLYLIDVCATQSCFIFLNSNRHRSLQSWILCVVRKIDLSAGYDFIWNILSSILRFWNWYSISYIFFNKIITICYCFTCWEIINPHLGYIGCIILPVSIPF